MFFVLFCFIWSFFLFILSSHAWVFKCSLLIILLIYLIYASPLFIFFLSYPPKGIQAPQPAVSQPAAAFGHHWVSSYTHIRQTVCWNGLRHLGQRKEPASFMLSQKPFVSAPPTSTHSLAPQHTVLYVGPCMSRLPFIHAVLHRQWRNQISVLILKCSKNSPFKFSSSFLYFYHVEVCRVLFCSVLLLHFG